MSIFMAFLMFFAIAFLLAFVGGVFAYISIKRKWNFRLVASLSVSLSIFIVVMMFWASAGDAWFLWGGLFLSIIQGMILYILLPGVLKTKDDFGKK